MRLSSLWFERNIGRSI